MSITKLSIENVKRISAVEISPDGSLVVVGGKNGQGKTSVLDSIEMALAGKSSVPSMPIRSGEDAARVVVETEDFVITRKFTKGKSYLSVEGRDGRLYKSPQTVLDGLVGSMAFDPFAFSRMAPKEQARLMREVAGIDTASIDAEIERLRDARRDANRSAKEASIRAGDMPRHGGVPDCEIPVADVVEAQRSRQQRNDRRAAIDHEVGRLEGEIARLQDALALLRSDRSELGDAEAAPNDEPNVQEVEETNAKVRANAAAALADQEAERLRSQAVELDTQLKRAEAERGDLLSSAEFPVSGIGVDSDGVTLDGVPFAQASSAQQIRVGVAMGAAIAKDIRVMLVRDGSLLDEDSMELLATLARDAGLQVWVERVGSGDSGAIVIEDGTLAE